MEHFQKSQSLPLVTVQYFDSDEGNGAPVILLHGCGFDCTSLS